MRNWIVIVAVIVVFTSCKSKLEKGIICWEAAQRCDIVNFELMGELTPFYAKDSAIILQKKYSELKHARIAQMENDILTINKELQSKRLEYETIQNESMKRLFRRSFQTMEERIITLEQNILVYQENAAATQLKIINDRIQYYLTDSSKLIAFSMQTEFVGKQGELPKAHYKKHYLFDVNQTHVLGEIRD